MLDLKFIRENFAEVEEGVRKKGAAIDLSAFPVLDEKRREMLKQVEELKALRNRVSEEIGQARRKGVEASAKIAEMKEVGERIKSLDNELKAVEDQLYQLQIRIPNLPHASVPVGKSAEDNVVIKNWGEIPIFEFTPKPHWELNEQLKIIDFEGGAKVAGSFFVNFTGKGAKLARALINFMLDLHVEKHGYTEVWPPVVVNRQAMFGTGQLPKLEEDMYRVEADDLFLIPTAEVPVTNLLANTTLRGEDLPIYYTAYTPCFRREAGAYGKDTKGLMRLHQFDKVEMVKFVKPETSYEEHEKLLQNAEEVLQLLGLPYRVALLCSGDMSFAAAKCYDLEVWAPGVKKWLEVSSCSNFEDFQARRANIRFRPQGGGKLEYVHTLNASGVALPRTIIGIMENYQTDEGTVMVPEVLRKYVGCEIIK
ncbi:MAG: serine--tRNA ligase [candidate division KSB1 bacterium]|nr:serine--tRNA ligase [candidate division KSB1 bacterium]MDZ7302906.1 serine--tRNA ligase [candidate division KSB1 bacterium]MDZ7310481.1 serine--tRNA ligase [candidate division KSB1 bacterium]